MHCTFLDQFPHEILVETPAGRRLRLKVGSSCAAPITAKEGQPIVLDFDYRGRVKEVRVEPEGKLAPIGMTFLRKVGTDLLFMTTEEKEYVLLSRARAAGLPKPLGIKDGATFLNFRTDLDGRVCEMTFQSPSAPARQVPVRRREG